MCIHAITTLVCDEVLEEVACLSPLFRCCLIYANNTNLATLVETSPPLEENVITTTLTPIETNSFEKHQSSSSASSNVHNLELNLLPNVTKLLNQNNHLSSQTTFLPASSTSTALSTSTSATQRITLKCTGVCMESKYSKYCGNILTNSGVCNDDNQICCLQSNKTIFTTTVNIPSTSELVTETIQSSSSSALDTTITTLSNTVVSSSTTISPNQLINRNQTNSSLNEKKIISNEDLTFKNTTESADYENNTALIKQSNNKNSDNPNDLPLCDHCVTLLFSLLCDRIDNDRYCPNGNRCCVDNSEPNNTETTEQHSNSQSASNNKGVCLGTCIPTILSGICTKPSEIILKTTTCITGMFCCYTAMTDLNEQQSFNSNNNLTANEKPSLLDSNSDDLTFIEPSESTLSNNNLNPKFKPLANGNSYYQLVPRPNHHHQFANHHLQSSTTPTNLLVSPNWPFLANQNLQKIPIYKPLLSNSQMIHPNPYLTTPTNARPTYAQVLNNRSPALFYQPPSLNNQPIPSDLFNNLNAHFSSNHLSANNILPTMPTQFQRTNLTSNLINHLLIANNIPQSSCIGTCMPPLLRFTCFGNSMIYTNFVCNKSGHLCCASMNDVEAYETAILGSLNNESSLISNLIHNNYYGSNLAAVAAAGLIQPKQQQASNLQMNNNKPVNSASNTMKNVNANKNLNNNKISNLNHYQLNNNKKQQPVIDRITNDNNALIDKLTDLNQPAASNNLNRNRYPASTSSINKSVPKLTTSINNNSNNNKWSSLSSSNSGHFIPSEKPISDKSKKPAPLMPILSTEYSQEISTSSKCKLIY